MDNYQNRRAVNEQMMKYFLDKYRGTFQQEQNNKREAIKFLKDLI